MQGGVVQAGIFRRFCFFGLPPLGLLLLPFGFLSRADFLPALGFGFFRLAQGGKIQRLQGLVNIRAAFAGFRLIGR